MTSRVAAGRGDEASKHRSQGFIVFQQLAHTVLVQKTIQQLLELLPIVDDDQAAVVGGGVTHWRVLPLPLRAVAGPHPDHDATVMPPPGLPRSDLVSALSINTPNDSVRVVKSSTMPEARTSRAPATWQ